MKFRSLHAVSILIVASVTITGCHSNKPVVPKAGSGKAVKEGDVVRKSAPPPTPERKFALLDRNQDDSLDMGEFIQNARTPESRQREMRVFHVVDRNQDGQVSFDEFTRRPSEAGHVYMDTNSDEVLTFEEFHHGDMRWAQVEHAQRVFQLMDRNDSGVLEGEEVYGRSTEAWFVRSDQDGDDRLSLEEYAARNVPLARAGRCELIFGLFDADRDGMLTLAEFSNSPPEESFFRRDTDGNAALSLDEFLASRPVEQRDDLTVTFEEKDYDGNGKISLTEFKLPGHDARFRRLDSDQDGSVSLEEFASDETTAESLARAMRVFSAKDADQDGALNASEFSESPKSIKLYENDTDGDGSWSVEEFHQADMKEATAEWARKTFDKMDRNGDGRLNPAEQASRSPQVWFMFLDADENGSVSAKEYSNFNPWLVESGHCTVVFDLMDASKDGSLTEAEFVNKPPEMEFYKRDRSGDRFLNLEEFAIRTGTTAEQTKVFKDKDSDRDGKMNLEEYLASPKKSRFDEMDLNGDGTLDLSEFHQGDMPGATAPCAQHAFEATDTDKSEGVDPAELRSRPKKAWFACMDVDFNSRMSQEEFAARNSTLVKSGRLEPLFRAMDVNGDGTVNEDEYCRDSLKVSFIRRDGDGDGKLTVAEFLVWTKTPEAIAKAKGDFEGKDVNRDKRLSIEEFSGEAESSATE